MLLQKLTLNSRYLSLKTKFMWTVSPSLSIKSSDPWCLVLFLSWDLCTLQAVILGGTSLEMDSASFPKVDRGLTINVNPCPMKLELFPQALISKTPASDTCFEVLRVRYQSLQSSVSIGYILSSPSRGFLLWGALAKLVVKWTAPLSYPFDSQEGVGRESEGIVSLAETQHANDSLQRKPHYWTPWFVQRFLNLI